jgi:hypothetical protein
MKKNLPVMNAELAHLQSPEATQRCPTGAIVWVEGGQFRGGMPSPDNDTVSLDAN